MASESYGTRLQKFWAPNGWAFLWLVFGLMPLFFFQTFVHEGLHWLTAKLDGSDPNLIPFAHYNNSPGQMRNLNGITLNATGFVATPQIVGLLLMIGLIVIVIFTSPRARWLRTFLTWWYLGLILDLLFNTGRGLFDASNPLTDWGKFAAQYGHGLATFLSWVILLVVVSQLVWIAISSWHVNRPPGVGFFDYRGLAIAYGVVSLIAVIASWAINDPSIDRNWWFWLVFLGQIASFVWYAVYLYLARSTERSVAHA